MDTTSPQHQNITVAKPSQPASAGLPPGSTAGAKPRVLTQSKQRNAGLKVVIRRLPPGLTESEFNALLGEEWQAGRSKVDWLAYAPGKISKDTANHSLPARAYLHLSDDYIKDLQPKDYLTELSAKLAETQFIDAKGSHTDPALLNPWPSLSEAPYGRIPSTKARKDNRQGTIDQDPEFIDFLQELTNPVVKSTPIDQLPEKTSKSEERIVTPLVQYLKDKKANKHKDSAGGSKAQKHGKQDPKEAKTAGQAQDKKQQSSKTIKGNSAESRTPAAQKPEKVSKEQVKVLNKQTTPAPSAKTQTSTPSATPSQTSNPATNAPKQERRRERGSAAAAAAKILQRDLGLNGPKPSRRRTESSNASNAGTAKGSTNQTVKTQDTATTNKIVPSSSQQPQTQTAPCSTVQDGAPTKPTTEHNSKASTKPAPANLKQTSASSKTNTPRQPAVTPTATQAFLKHANPSQGITEELLQSTFATFGTVTKVEIDKKKGFAYVDFAEPASLQKAISTSPIKIAQGQVVVLERKSSAKTKQPRVEGKGGRGAAAAGAVSSSSAQRSGRGRGRNSKNQAEDQNQPQGASTTTTAAPALVVSSKVA